MAHGDVQRVLPIAPRPSGHLPQPGMIPRDAEGPQARQPAAPSPAMATGRTVAVTANPS